MSDTQPGDINKALGNNGGPWPLIVGGVTYHLSYPDLGTLGQFVAWAKKLALEALSLARQYTDAQGFAAYAAVVNAELGPKRLYEWGGQRCLEALYTDEGLSYFLWLLLRAHHPKLTAPDARKLIADSVKEDPGERGADGQTVREAYIVQTILDMTDPGKSPAPTTGAAPVSRS